MDIVARSRCRCGVELHCCEIGLDFVTLRFKLSREHLCVVGPPIQVVGMALITEFCEHNINPYLCEESLTHDKN